MGHDAFVDGDMNDLGDTEAKDRTGNRKEDECINHRLFFFSFPSLLGTARLSLQDEMPAEPSLAVLVDPSIFFWSGSK